MTIIDDPSRNHATSAHETTHLACPSCSQPIVSADINLDHLVAKCAACNAVISIEGLAATDASPRSDELRDRPAMHLPDGVRLEDWGPNLRIIRRWFTPMVFFLVFFCAIWDGFLILWYSLIADKMLGGSSGAPQAIGWFFVVFPLVHVAAGVGLTYFTICCFTNKSVIEVGGGQLEITHGPLPWPGRKSIATADLEQLYCRERVRRTRNGSSVTYQLEARLRNGSRTKLLSGLPNAAQVHYIEQQIEQRLGIPDRAIAGEFL